MNSQQCFCLVQWFLFSVAALGMVNNLKKEGWLVCNTEFRSHLCFGLCWCFLCIFWAPMHTHVGSNGERCFPCVRGSHQQLWTCVPPLLPQLLDCGSSWLGASKIPCARKNPGQKIYWKCRIVFSVSQVCPTEQDVRSCSYLNLTHQFFAKRAPFWSIKWLYLHNCKFSARQGSGFVHTKEHFGKSRHVPASITYLPWLGEPGCLGRSRVSAGCDGLAALEKIPCPMLHTSLSKNEY